MADNVTADPGSGGATFKTDEDTGASAHVPVTKIELGVDNSFDGYVSTTNPMPSAGNVAHDAVDANNPVKVGGRALTTLPTAVGTGDRVDAIYTTQGAATVAGVDGTTPRAVAVNASGQLEIDIAAQQGAALDVSGATVTVTGDAGGSLTVDTAGGALDVDLGTNNDVQGAGAEAAAPTGNPFLIAGDDGSVVRNVAVDASGNVQVDIVADGAGLALASNQLADGHNVTVDNAAGTNSVPVQGDAAENAPVTGNPVLSGGRYDLTPRTLGDGDVGAIALDPDGAVHISDGGNTITVDGTVTATPTGTQNVDVTANTIGLATSANQLPDGHNVTVDNAAGASAVNIQDGGNKITVDWNGTDPPIGGGTQAAALRVTLATDSPTQTVDAPVGTPVNVQIGDGTDTALVSAAGALSVSIDGETASVTVDQATASNLNAQVVGAGAHDIGVTGNPVLVGVEAQNVGASPTAVADGDLTRLMASRYGQLFTLGGHMNMTTREYFKDGAQTNDPIIDTIAAGTRIVIFGIEVVAPNSNAADVGCRIGFGAASVPTKPADGGTVDGMVVSADALAPGSGIVKGHNGAIVAVGGDGEELRLTSSGTDNLNVIVTYFTYTA